MRADATGRLTPAQHYLRSPTAMQRQNEVSPIVKNFIITAAYQSELNSHLFRMLHKRLPLRHRILSCLVGHPHPGPSPAILPLNQFLANASWEAADEGSSTGPLPQHGKLKVWALASYFLYRQCPLTLPEICLFGKHSGLDLHCHSPPAGLRAFSFPSPNVSHSTINFS